MASRPIHIGDCHKCPAEGVPIPYGWKTRDNQHCRPCNYTRILNKRVQQAKNFLRKSYRKGGQRKFPQRPVKGQVRRMLPKSTKRQKEKMSEDARINAQIWRDRKHECFECGKGLHGEPVKGYFSHVIGKGARPDLRFVKRNIVLHCHPGGCHQIWETGKRRESMPKTLKLYNELCVEFKDNKFQRE